MLPDLKFLLLFLLICGILICGYVWYYKKYISIYSEIPQINYLRHILKCLLLSKIPKHIPINSFFFQTVIEKTKEFQSEGLCLVWIFQPYLFIYSEEACKVFGNEQNTINKPYNFDLFKEFFMNSLLTSGGDLWRKRRKMLNPVFYTSNLKDTTTMINKNAKYLVKNLHKNNSEASADITKPLKDCAIRNVLEFLSDSDTHNDQSNANVAEAVDCVNKSSKMIINRIVKPWLHPRCFLPLFSKGRLFLKTAEKGLKVAEKTLKWMRGENYSHSRQNFVQIITEYNIKNSSYTSKDMQGELTGLIAAGFDTVSYALMWTLFLLGHHLDVQDQVHEEIESVIGHNDEVSYEDLENLKYLERVIKESLRLYPPVPIYARRTVTNVQCGKYMVPKNTNIVFWKYLAHRNPTVFPDPEKFYPDRFLEGNCDKSVLYSPFAEGVRNCIGKKFAMIEMKIILAHVIKNFNVKSVDRREDINLCWEVVLTTAKPIHMDFIPRNIYDVQNS